MNNHITSGSDTEYSNLKGMNIRSIKGKVKHFHKEVLLPTLALVGALYIGYLCFVQIQSL